MIDKSTFNTRTALFHTFGCKLNFAETSTVARIFAENGIRRVAAGEVPDFIVINTCSVTELADKKCRQTIRSFAKRFPAAKILVTGCYAQLKPQEVSELPNVAVVAGTNQKHKLAEYLSRWEETGIQQRDVVATDRLTEFSPSCSRGDRTRYFLKIQDGCDYFCTYCTIPMARGRSRSGLISEVVKQAEDVAADGGKEIVITGVNIGDFGKRTGETFIDLIRNLDRVDGIKRYRISSIEPNLLTEEIIDFVACSKRFMPHFHVPLQSGSDVVLKLMHRHYDTEHFAHKMELIRRAMPDAFIGVDLIVGARGETDEEFRRSMEFVEGLDISRLHVFPYSERPGTRALSIDHVVDQAEKHRRTSIMLNISDRKLENFCRRFENQTRAVLIEHGTHPESVAMSGFTDNYIRVVLENADPLTDNTIRPVRLLSTMPGGEEMKGELI